MAEDFDGILDSINACCATSEEFAEELKGMLRAEMERVVELEEAIDAVVAVRIDRSKPMPDEMFAAILYLALVRRGMVINPDADAGLTGDGNG